MDCYYIPFPSTCSVCLTRNEGRNGRRVPAETGGEIKNSRYKNRRVPTPYTTVLLLTDKNLKNSFRYVFTHLYIQTFTPRSLNSRRVQVTLTHKESHGGSQKKRIEGWTKGLVTVEVKEHQIYWSIFDCRGTDMGILSVWYTSSYKSGMGMLDTTDSFPNRSY